MASNQGYQAVVEKIIRGGKHGPYAVARTEEIGLVTFSLDGNVWQEKDWPEPGMYVMLSQVRKKPAGWRAQHGRFMQPFDEPQNQHRTQRRNEK